MNARNIILCIVQLSLLHNATNNGWTIHRIDGHKIEISKICENPDNVNIEDVFKNIMPLCWQQQRYDRTNNEYTFVLSV